MERKPAARMPAGRERRPWLRTPRLQGEPADTHHAQGLLRALEDPRIYRFVPQDPPTLSHLSERLAAWRTGRSPDGSQLWLNWVLTVCAGDGLAASEPNPIGLVQATVEPPKRFFIAYLIHPAHWRKGYASEAVAAAIDAVFGGYQVECAVAELDTRNQASRALVERLGFRRVRTVLNADEFKGQRSDEYVYELARSDWVGGRG